MTRSPSDATTLPDLEPATIGWQRVDDALVSCAGLLKTLCRDEIGDTCAAELEYVRSALAARSAPEAGKAVVKPLEWNSEPPYSVARPFAGLHYATEVVWPESGKAFDYVLLSGPTVGAKRFASLSDAKAAAQQDFEQRVLSCLASVAPSGAEPVTKMCERCQGNGEIVTNWDRYLDPSDRGPGEESFTECPDCDGTGTIPCAWKAEALVATDQHAVANEASATLAPQAVPAEDVAGLIQRLRDRASGYRSSRFLTIPAELLDEAAAALTSLSAERDHYAASELAGVEKARELFKRLEVSEAEAAEEMRQAYESARYVPGDHPVVPAKIDAFMKVAARTLSGASE